MPSLAASGRRYAEAVVTADDLARAWRVWFINSVRGWLPARLVND